MPTSRKPLLGLERSKLWKALEQFLKDRREATIMRPAQTRAEMWRREGALLELNMLLALPKLVADYDTPPAEEPTELPPRHAVDIDGEWNA